MVEVLSCWPDLSNHKYFNMGAEGEKRAGVPRAHAPADFHRGRRRRTLKTRDAREAYRRELIPDYWISLTVFLNSFSHGLPERGPCSNHFPRPDKDSVTYNPCGLQMNSQVSSE